MRYDKTNNIHNKKSSRKKLCTMLALLLVGGSAVAQSIGGSVYGGGKGTSATVTGAVTVEVQAGTVGNDVYGGGALANVNGNTTVNLTGGKVTHNLYGGGLGNSTNAVTVGSTLVTVNGGEVDNVFGCNNVKGAPTSTVQVDIEKTAGSMTVNNVYGGGNQAAYTGSPTVNIKNGTVSGEVFGGGLGNSAIVTGNPQVTVNGAVATTIVSGGVYGGGSQASTSGNPTVTLTNGALTNVYGGGKAANVTGAPTVNINGGTVSTGVYGGCNASGTVSDAINVYVNGGTIGTNNTHAYGVFGGGYGTETGTGGNVTVTIGNVAATMPTVYGDIYGGSAKGNVNDANSEITKVWLKKGVINGDIYGGGYGADQADAKVNGQVQVLMNDGTVNNVFGCNNESGAPQSAVQVEITGGTVNTNVYGGGNLANASCAPHVIISNSAAVKGDVYGGGAFASTGATTVDILGGTIGTSGNTTLGNVFGGGLGGVHNSTTYTPAVNGTVILNIGAATATNATTGAMTSPSGNATILGSVYGCNNTKGSPTGNVTVNIYQTAHTSANQTSGTGYAIKQVFGGGKLADYNATGKKATVNIWGCDNTIERVFGGSDAAKAPNVETNLYGGRFDYIFGGGNGEEQAADITGNVNLNVHGGRVGHLFGGSNTSGLIGGATNVLVDNAGACDQYIAEFFGGGNKVPITGDVNTTIGCGTTFGDVYGGSNQADITGDVTLTVKGSTFKNIFGGSKGDLSNLPGTGHSNIAADITGNVTLNLLGGTVQKENNEGGNVFGGSNYNGNITGKITVNVFDDSECPQPFSAVNLYGAGNLTAYTPTDPALVSPEVNVIYIKNNKSISGNVYGGGLGASATVTANPKVTIGYDEATMGTPTTNSSLIQGLVGSSYTMPETLYATVGGNVYGGGDLAAVLGSTSVNVQQANTQIGSDVYGGGNKANVSGSVTVNVNGGTITHDVYGGGALADVNVTNDALTSGATTTVNLRAGTVTGSVYGGGLGQISPSIAAKVYGPVQVNAIGGNIGTVFGCNNLYGAPQSTVQVTMEKSTAQGAPELNINNVYGGGNQAPYSGNPVVNIKNGNVVKQGTTGGNVFGGGYGASATVNGNPQLTIGDITAGHDGYHAVVEGSAFGGGDAAAVNGVPVVLVQKCNTEVGLVYGGGNAADVYATNITVTGGNTIGEVYGGCFGADVTGATGIPGNTLVNIKGGTITQVYGGNNASGEIVGRITVNVDKADNACDMHIHEVYGGGNQAASKSNEDQINIACTGGVNEGIDYVYGGANEAGVTGNIVLDITDGRIGNVFGGNNKSGVISGKITVNINEKADPCGWNIGNVYGGGNLAAYTAPTGTPNYPEVNLLNGAVSGDVFGGGLGSTAVVTGNPRVTANGANAVVSGNVYGGGSAASVSGNPVVTLTNGDLTNVFGGSKAADISGAPTVYINGGSVSTGVYGGCHTSGTVSDAINVYVNGGTVGTSGTAAYGVFGGGYGAGTGTGNNVTVTIGNEDGLIPTIYGPVYGGSAKGNVNDATAEITKLWLKKGSITGDIYGGGYGDGGADAKVNGKVQVVVDGGSISGSVYGCNNTAGAPQSTVNVDIYHTTGVGEVFGGGNQAAFNGTPVVKIHNNNTIGNVYGGGNAAAVAGTDVTVYGGTITNVYGGCYGANVTASGTNVKIYGGTITKVFGANNSSGNVSGSINVTIKKQGDNDPQGTPSAPEMHIAEVYGGGNEAPSSAGTITVGCTGTGATEGIGDLYGGANNAAISGNIQVDITEGRITNVYGGNNAGGTISGSITVNIEKDDEACVWDIDNVFGGGNLANFGNQANVNIKKGTINHCVYGGGNRANVGSSVVTLTDGLITEGLYGGCNREGSVTGDITLNVNGGQVGVDASHKADIYGGGYGENTLSGGNVTVNFGTIATTNPEHTAKPEVFGDIYGGSALGKVNGTGKTTTVNILNGVVNGNIYGGGLGQIEPSVEAKVFGKVFVNIGRQATPTDEKTGVGFAYLNNTSVYGCNNQNGSPQDDATVNIWMNGRCIDVNSPYHSQYEIQPSEIPVYSIDQVFGGGNKADFTINNKFTYVVVHDCSNSVRRVFGGSDASAAYGVNTTIHGGRYDFVYGGGNGEVTPANIGDGGVHLTVTAGIVNQLYGGSNQNGTNTGSLVVNVSALSASDACSEDITEFFCGGNFADVVGNVNTEIDCNNSSSYSNITSIYGGCNHAKVKDWPEGHPNHGKGGNVTLTIKGGNFTNVFGGSKGEIEGFTEGKRRHRGDYSADIEGNITLNIYGGTITNVYGGSNILGNVDGTITVNILDHGDSRCPLELTNVYGGGNMTKYTPKDASVISPRVNVIHGTVLGNVYGGAKGYANYPATITSNPRVIIGYDSSMSNLLPTSGLTIPATNFRATVNGDIFGGGDAAEIKGNTEIQLKDHSKVRGNIYGGGNKGEVLGNTKVIVNGKDQ